MASPRDSLPSKRSATFLSGWPAKRARKFSLQPTLKPHSTGAAARSRRPWRAAVPPSRHRSQAAANSRRRARAPWRPARAIFAVGTAKQQGALAVQPSQRPARQQTRRLARSSRASQARSSGDAFMAFGKTRPLEPMKVGWPRPSAQAISADGGKRFQHRAELRGRIAIAREQTSRTARNGSG